MTTDVNRDPAPNPNATAARVTTTAYSPVGGVAHKVMVSGTKPDAPERL